MSNVPTEGPEVCVADRLRAALFDRWRINTAGGWCARLARRRVMHHLLLARIGRYGRAEGETFWGAPIIGHTRDHLARGLLAFGYEECALTALMLEILQPGMRFVDIGAHIGFQSMLAAEIVGPSGRVVSFEPQLQILDYCARNLQPYSQIRLVQSAVGDSNGSTLFHQMKMEESGFSSSDLSGSSEIRAARRYSVRVVTLDGALGSEELPVDVIKCDVEGAEMSVLRGAKAVLAADRPLLVLEGEMPNGSAPRPRIEEFCRFLAPLGYQPIAFEFFGKLEFGPLDRIEMGHASIAFVHPMRTEFRFLLP